MEYRTKAEFPSPPEEFAAPAPEFTPPPEEFAAPRPALDQRGTDPARRRRRKLAALLLAAVVSGAALFPQHIFFKPTTREAQLPGTADRPTSPGSAESEPSAPSPVSTAKPQPAPTPTPTATPEPTPEPAPDCEVTFVSFSDTARFRLGISNPMAVQSIHAELWDTLTDSLEETVDVPADSIAAGEYLSQEFSLYDIWERHSEAYMSAGVEPDPELRVTMRYTDGGSEQEQVYTVHAAAEQGWYVFYCPRGSTDYYYNYPGCFTFVTYSSYQPVTVKVNAPDSDLAAGEISICAVIGGKTLATGSADITVVEEEGYRADGTRVPMYTTVAVLPLPEELPEGRGNSAHFTVTQKLQHSDSLWVTEQDLEF